MPGMNTGLSVNDPTIVPAFQDQLVRSGRRWAGAAGLACAALGLASCGTSALPGAPTGAVAAPSKAPLPASVQTRAGTWATVPMGDLGQPLNTFRQLFFRPAGSASWSDRVQATATATNGGLVLADDNQDLVVGVRPSNMLTFSRSEELALDAGSDLASWARLPPPPPGTATVTFGPGEAADALAVNRTVLTVWALSRDRRTWTKIQVVHVPIQFGSSS